MKMSYFILRVRILSCCKVPNSESNSPFEGFGIPLLVKANNGTNIQKIINDLQFQRVFFK